MARNSPIKASHPNGHFYSPVVNPAALKARENELWPDEVSASPGIDFNDASHRQILVEMFPRFISDYDYPEHADENVGDESANPGFYTQNTQFSWMDSRALFVLMRTLQFRQIIEVGSGFSSLLMADINHRFLDLHSSITCIEPYPRDFLREEIAGLDRVIVEPVQQVPLSTFEALNAGDLLFIDSSHVAKTGSDLNYVMFEIVPRLQAGVYIHFHDIFLPAEYPKEWVLEDNRSWNEQYVLQALLMLCNAFEVVFGANYAALKHPALVQSALAPVSKEVMGGGSFWIRKLA